jgi:hypothetical protein
MMLTISVRFNTNVLLSVSLDLSFFELICARTSQVSLLFRSLPLELPLGFGRKALYHNEAEIEH